MIKSLKIKNFQSHKYSELNFSDKVNVVCGLSDSGKSSVIRSLKAILYRDRFFVMHKEKEGTISIDFNDYSFTRECKFSELKKCPECGEKIEEKQQLCKCGEILSGKPTIDKYIVGPNEFEKFGKTLPEFILEKTRMFPIKFVDIEENLQLFNQHDDMFFIGPSYSGGKRNKIISSLFPDSDRIDFLIKKLNSDASTKKCRIDLVEQERKELNEKIAAGKESYDMIRILSEQISEYKEELMRLKEDISMLSTLKRKIDSTTNIIKYSQKIKQIGLVIDKLNERIKLFEITNDKCSKLKQIKVVVEKKFDFEIKKFDFESVSLMKNKTTSLEKLKVISEKIKRKYDFEIKKFDVKSDIKQHEDLGSKIGSLGMFKVDIQDVYGKKIEELSQTVDNATNAIVKKKEEFKEFLGSSNTLCPLINEEFCDKCKRILVK